MKTKICSVCGIEKPIEEFGFRDKQKGTYRANCKSCHSKAMKDKYHKNKELLNDAKKNLSCEKCGYNKCLEALEFHHIDSTTKINTVARLSVHSNIETATQEMKKCIVLCANCHREFHFLEKATNITLEEFLK